MTPRRFATAMKEAGFEKESVSSEPRFRIEYDGLFRYVARTSVRGAAWRLHMAIGDVPAEWPTLDLNPTSAWVEAESPWFEYVTDLDPSDPEDAQFDSRETALQKCHDWLLSTGMLWLIGDADLTDHEWRTEHSIVVKRCGSR